VHFVEDILPIESSNRKQARVLQEGDVVSSRGGLAPVDGAVFVLEGDCDEDEKWK
jgi:hypothetical protein